jgi:hypothetical protein
MSIAKTSGPVSYCSTGVTRDEFLIRSHSRDLLRNEVVLGT